MNVFFNIHCQRDKKIEFKIYSYDRFIFTDEGLVEVRLMTDKDTKAKFSLWNIIFDNSLIENQVTSILLVGLQPAKLTDLKFLVRYVNFEGQAWYNDVFEKIASISIESSSETTNKIVKKTRNVK